MADETEVLPPEPEHDEEEGGGPVKSFLEHLEDLRWTLVKCAIAIAVGIIICLSASSYIIAIIKWPLKQAELARVTRDPRVILMLGTNVLSRLPASQFPVEGMSTNADTVFKLSPALIGTNWVLSAVQDASPPPDATYGMNVGLKTYSPAGGFTIAIQIMLFGGFTVSAPFVLFFIGQFVLPAMHVHEKRFLYRVAAFATVLFFAGLAFCYFVMLPITLSTTVAFSNWLGFSADEWRADEFISFTCWFLLGMGLAFQLPLVLLTLVKIGLLDSPRLRRFRSYFYVGILIVAGFVTPDGNPFTMLLMAAPLMGLYELTVLIAWWGERKDRSRATDLE